jgi:hypothetical protein
MRSSSISIASPRWAATRCGANARDELLHRERLHDVVVRAELERPHAVLLTSARAHDDDRSADPFLPRRLDDLPPVELGKHQVEHADVGALVAQACKCGRALADPDRVEARNAQMTRHAVCDDVVVLDDQHLWHPFESSGSRRRLWVRAW